LRIISGKAKGLTLAGPPPKSGFIRPTSDRSREALFSIIGGRIEGAKVLDLYAGTGALGIESLSRGCASAVFVDNNSTSLSLIKRNLASFSRCINDELSARAAVIKADLRRGFNLPEQLAAFETSHFDIIFLDPPYDKGLALKTLNHLDQKNILCDDGLIIVEERIKTVMPDNLESLALRDKRKYGDTGFWLYSAK